MDQRDLPYRNKSIKKVDAYFWTKGDEPELVRQVNEVDVANPRPKEYEVRQDPPVVLFENPKGEGGPILVTAFQHWNMPEMEEGEDYAIAAIPLGDEEDVTNLINELIRIRNERWPVNF